jgi:hypothetical protein
VRLRVIRHLIAHARREVEHAAIGQFSLQLAGDAEQDMSILTPVIGLIPRRVFDESHADGPKLFRTPACQPNLPRVPKGVDLLPISNPKRDIPQLHECRPG